MSRPVLRAWAPSETMLKFTFQVDTNCHVIRVHPQLQGFFTIISQLDHATPQCPCCYKQVTKFFMLKIAGFKGRWAQQVKKWYNSLILPYVFLGQLLPFRASHRSREGTLNLAVLPPQPPGAHAFAQVRDSREAIPEIRDDSKALLAQAYTRPATFCTHTGRLSHGE